MEIHDFDIFWNKHFEDLKRYAFSLTKKKDLADSLMNDTYVRARDKLHLYKQDNNFEKTALFLPFKFFKRFFYNYKANQKNKRHRYACRY